MLGMTVALRLAQQGQAVTLFEAAPYLGGVASAWQLGDVSWDRHYHVVLQSDIRLRALLKELGLEKELQWKKARTGFFVDSHLHSLSNILDFLRFPPLNILEKLRLAATILYASSIGHSGLEKVPVQKWLEKWSGKSVTRKLWLPLLRAKLGGCYTATSAAFIWATIARMYAARRSGAKTEMFGYAPGGYARILNVFEERLRMAGVNICLGSAVRAVRKNGAGTLAVDLGKKTSRSFSHVAVTAASPIAASICPELRDGEKSRLRSTRYQGLVCASLLLKKPLSDFYITNIADSRIPFTAVIEMSALVDRAEFRGRSLVYLPKYVEANSPDLASPDDDIRESFLSALEQMYPHFRRDCAECFQVSRVKYLLPVPTLNYSTSLPSHFTSVPGLHLVNSSQIVHGTLNVNETVALAEAAVRLFADVRSAGSTVPNFLGHAPIATHC